MSTAPTVELVTNLFEIMQKFNTCMDRDWKLM